MTEKITAWWSDDGRWFCILANDGVSQATVSLTPEEAQSLAALAQAQEPGPTTEDIYACAETTLIGFRDELTEDQIKFICDQISRKATLSHNGTRKENET